MLGYFYSSFIISILIWSRIYVTFVLLWIVLLINKWITQKEGCRLAIATEAPARP